MEAHKKSESTADKARQGDGGAESKSDRAAPKQEVEHADLKKEEGKPATSKQNPRARTKSKNNVRKLRMERMMSKAELARRAAVSSLTIDRVERGMPCRMDTKRKILEALGLKPSDRVMVFGDSPDDLEED
jgi:DNA-binding XRE family transcriptional regulator